MSNKYKLLRGLKEMTNEERLTNRRYSLLSPFPFKLEHWNKPEKETISKSELFDDFHYFVVVVAQVVYITGNVYCVLSFP